MKRVLALFVVSFIPVLSCGGTADAPGESIVEAPAALVGAPAAVVAAAEVPVVEEPAPATEEFVAPTLPTGTFHDVHALCAQQMKDVLPLLAQAERNLVEGMGDTETKLVPSCNEDAAAMRGVRVSLGAPYLEAKAVSYETGEGTQTNLVMRTSAGWTNVGTSLVASYHNDPGCPSILRDSGLTEVRVENGQVVVVDKAERGAGDNANIVYERTRTCTLTACTEPVTLSETVVPWVLTTN